MIIQLNVLQNGSCTQIYAYAEDHEESSFIFLYDIRAVKIWHNKNMFSMQPFFSSLKNCDNDYFVLFKSSVPFREFCDQFFISEYNSHHKYHFFRHNCANAANYALKLAKIELEITSSIRLSRINPNSIIKIPSTVLTPSDMYHLAKNYKIKEVKKVVDKKQYFSGMYFKIELATAKLCLWAKKADDDRVRDNIEIISSEIESNMQTRTHHAGFYLKALIDTIDIVMHLTNKNDLEDYQKFSSYFKERELSRSLQIQNRQFKLFVFQFLLASIETLTGIEEDWRITYLSCITAVIICCSLFRTLRQEGYDHTPTIKNDTKLSQAMSYLATCVEETAPSTLLYQYHPTFLYQYQIHTTLELSTNVQSTAQEPTRAAPTI